MSDTDQKNAIQLSTNLPLSNRSNSTKMLVIDHTSEGRYSTQFPNHENNTFDNNNKKGGIDDFVSSKQ